MRLPPTNVQLRRAQLALVLAVLLPTVLMTVLGIVLLVVGESAQIVIGVLVLVLCLTGFVGYVLGSLFVGKGASLARIQNDFLSGVSHELRTPLTSMRLLLQTLGNDRLSSEDRAQVLHHLETETTRLDGLAARLIELSKLELGAYALRYEDVLVCDVVGDAITAFVVATGAARTEVAQSIPSDLRLVCDRQALAGAFTNLLVNAWKYSDAPRRIEISALAGKRFVEVAVRDNGIGMSVSEQREVFDPFVRAASAHARAAPGAGLGLPFVRAIVRAHRGKISVQSASGQGTTITMRIPFHANPQRDKVRSA